MSVSVSRAATAPGPWRHRPGPLIWALGVAQVVSWGTLYYSFPLFVVPMQKEFGWSLEALNGALSAGLLVSGLCTYGAGAWIDRYGGRGLMAFGSVGTALLVLE